MSLQTIIDLSRKYGGNPELVLGGGGNTSYKDNKYLYVKTSGSSLTDITENGFVKIDRKKLFCTTEKTYQGDEASIEAAVLADLLAARAPGQEAKRPSVEALLHGLFEQKYVVHLHPAIVNGLTCGAEGRASLHNLFDDKAVWLDETKPGYVLATVAQKVINEYKVRNKTPLNLLFLQNHGVFFAGDDEQEISSLIDYVLTRFDQATPIKPDLSKSNIDYQRAVLLAPAIRMLTMSEGSAICRFESNKSLLDYLRDEDAFAHISSSFTPDHIVYCRHKPLYVRKYDNIDEQYDEIKSAIIAYENECGQKPKIVCVQQLGFFACGSSERECELARVLFLDTIKIAVYTTNFGGYRFLSDKMIDFIRNWEVESYRSKVAFTNTKKRLANKIVIITGGAQGIGAGLAQSCVDEGALVVAADINERGVRQFEQNTPNVTGIICDVTNPDSVKAMINNTVLKFGGIDVFVSNAGIVRSGSLDELTLEDFDLTTRINYQAYFICVKAVSDILRLQHRFNANYYTDIVQINSKSGLQGSNKNFAYAGSKFGGIGLTQSFALELAEFRIKVNAICPGNFLDGPLWSEPKNGLFVQYLNAGKVPGAKTVDDVRRFYEAKVPLGRGCAVMDVAKALFYIVEQQYETGQALPVTGGQTMLS